MTHQRTLSLVIVILFSFYVLSRSTDPDKRPIFVRLKSELPSLRTRSQTDPQLLRNIEQLENIARLRPLIQESERETRSREYSDLAAHRLTRYYEISPEQIAERSPNEIVSQLRNNPLVESVQVEPVSTPAGSRGLNQTATYASSVPDYTNCAGSEFQTCQKYMLEPQGRNGWKIGGVNGFQAHQQSNNYGENSRIVVMEIGCPEFNHIDIVRQPFIKLGQIQIDDHSTMSAGIMVGIEANGFGVEGIAAKAQVGYAKWGPQMLVDLRYYLSAGDVIQIGVQYGDSGAYCPDPNNCWVPVETVSLVQDTIRYLTQTKGVHVIMAAANGNVNLDHRDFQGRYSRSRDTGGIYAGACSPKTGVRASFSDYGSRVDVFSWGMDVTTTYWQPGRTDLFTTSFSGTSSANPIIAGCTAFLQSVARSKGIGNVDPLTMRQILVDSGHPLAYPDSKNIGKQPDLVKAIQLLDQLLPGGPGSSTTTTTTTTRATTTTTTRATTTTTEGIMLPTTSTGSPSSAPETAGCEDVAAWNSDRVYDINGEEVVYDADVYRQFYWNQNQAPDMFNGEGQPWQWIKSCNGDGGEECHGIPLWDGGKRYMVLDEKVAWKNKVYKVNFVSVGARPDENSAPWGQPWILVGDC